MSHPPASSQQQQSSAFDLEDFVIYLSAQLCGCNETMQALQQTEAVGSHVHLYWRSPILQEMQDEEYAKVPHQSPSPVYVDALFQLAPSFCSVQFGGLILEANGNGGRDVCNTCLTLDELRVLFEEFGYDLFLQENSLVPAKNFAKALNSLQNYYSVKCNNQIVAVTMTLGPSTNASLTLYDSSRGGESDHLAPRLVQRTIRKAIASSNNKAENMRQRSIPASNTDQDLLDQAILQWKQRKFRKPLFNNVSGAPKKSPIAAVKEGVLPNASSMTESRTSPAAAANTNTKKKVTAMQKPKMATIRKAPTRAHKFGFAGSK
jgi:hypothetical protein